MCIRDSGNTGTVLNVAVNYGGRQEIVRGMQILARRVQQGMLPVSYTHLDVYNRQHHA